MELVYLWVEEYKNIKNQGFNFSPRFACEFKAEYEKYTDENGEEKERLKENCELVINPKEFIENFFGENINITAIVGENGSGKSSLIETIMLILYNRFDREYLLIIDYKNKELEYISPKNKNFPNIKYIGNLIESESYHLNLISGLKKSFFNHYLNGIINKTEEYYRGNMSYEQSVLIKTAKVFSDNPDCLSVINKDFIFDKVTFSITVFNPNDIEKDLSEKSQELVRHIKASTDSLRIIYKKFVSNESESVDANLLEKISSFNKIPTDLTKLLIYNILVGLTKLFSYDRTEAEKFSNILQNYQDNIDLNISGIIKDIEEMLLEDNYRINPIVNILDNINKLMKHDVEKFTFVETIGFELTLKMADNFDSIEEYIKKYFSILKGFSEDYFEFQMIGIEFFSSKNQDISFFDLSDGEKRLLSQLIEVQYELLKSAPNYILLLDEPDTSLHPDWNKEFINLLLQVINSTKTIHFIISSHSPFILSDLPKENVIFLEKDEKTGECINATNRVNLNTFGANIHTLLSHGFFMRDGLMSKFAKGKIDKAIKYLNQKSLSKEEIDYCENIISIIGEPILKQQLQKILDSKRLNKMDEIDRLKADISELYQKLKKLEGRK